MPAQEPTDSADSEILHTPPDEPDADTASGEEVKHPLFDTTGWKRTMPLPEVLERIAVNLAAAAGDCRRLNVFDKAAVKYYRPHDVIIIPIRARYLFEQWSKDWAIFEQAKVIELPDWQATEWMRINDKAEPLISYPPYCRSTGAVERWLASMHPGRPRDWAQKLINWPSRQAEFEGKPQLPTGDFYWANDEGETWVFTLCGHGLHRYISPALRDLLPRPNLEATGSCVEQAFTTGQPLEAPPLLDSSTPAVGNEISSLSDDVVQATTTAGSEQVPSSAQGTGNASSPLPLYVDRQGLAYWTQSQIAEVGDLYATVSAACFRIADIMKDIRAQSSPG